MVREQIDNQILAIESDAGVFALKGFGFTGSDQTRTIVSDIHEPVSYTHLTLPTICSV